METYLPHKSLNPSIKPISVTLNYVHLKAASKQSTWLKALYKWGWLEKKLFSYFVLTGDVISNWNHHKGLVTFLLNC